MPNARIANPWGKPGADVTGLSRAHYAYDAQRADLWQMDLSGVVQRVSNQLLALISSTGSDQAHELNDNLPPPTEAIYWVQSVDLAELRIDSPVVPRDTLPYLMPGADAAPGPVRMTFLVDAGSPTPPRGSRLLSLLYAWRSLARVGRGSFDGGFADQSDYELSMGLIDANSATMQPDYRYDVVVNLLRGGVPQSQFLGNFVELPAEGIPASPIGLEVAATLKIRQMWLTGLQPPILQYPGGAALWAVAATFACTGWLPIPVQDQVF
jgi:hypothetical protein